MSNKRIPELVALYPDFVPDQTDQVVIYDSSANITKATAMKNLIPAGVNGLLFKCLTGDAAGSNGLTAQPWFPAQGAVTVEADKTYSFEGYLRISRAAGTTSHTTALLFGGTATVASIAYQATANTGDTVAAAAANNVAAEVATATVVKAASTSATEQISVLVKGTVRFSAAGTFIPQFIYSAAPGGAPSILKNSFFKLLPLGNASVASQGTWS